LLARRYGIEEAEAEPGFEAIIEDVAGYLLKPAWSPRKSFRGNKVIHETNIVIDTSTGQRQRERYLQKELGSESRAGAGRMLPLWYDWWKQRRGGDSINDIAETAVRGQGMFDERSIRSGIEQVERLMRPVEKETAT